MLEFIVKDIKFTEFCWHGNSFSVIYWKLDLVYPVFIQEIQRSRKKLILTILRKPAKKHGHFFSLSITLKIKYWLISRGLYLNGSYHTSSWLNLKKNLTKQNLQILAYSFVFNVFKWTLHWLIKHTCICTCRYCQFLVLDQVLLLSSLSTLYYVFWDCFIFFVCVCVRLFFLY